MKKLRTLFSLLVVNMLAVQSAWADDVVANVTLKEKNSLSSEILALADIDDVKTVTHLTVTTNEGVQLGDEDWTTLRSMAWAFTRICMLGVWRYLGNVDEAKSPRFLFVFTLTTKL